MPLGRRVVHLPSHFVHTPCGAVKSDLLREPEYQQFIVMVELDIRSEDIINILKPKPLKATLIVIGKLPYLFHGPFPVQECMEIGKEYSDLETGSLQVHQLVNRDEMAKVDLATRFVAGIHSFIGL